MIMKGRLLPRPPDKTYDRKPLQRITMKQILTVSFGIGARKFIRKPVIVSYERFKENNSLTLNDIGWKIKIIYFRKSDDKITKWGDV
jgi:hypothetical protein